jgi:hypothetical protein
LFKIRILERTLLSQVLESFNQYRTLGFPKEQIFKMMSKTEFALLTFYFAEKAEQSVRQTLITHLEIAEIIENEK